VIHEGTGRLPYEVLTTTRQACRIAGAGRTRSSTFQDSPAGRRRTWSGPCLHHGQQGAGSARGSGPVGTGVWV